MKTSVKDCIRKDLAVFSGYESARSLHTKAQVFLDANECPIDPGPGRGWNKYPHPQPTELVSELSSLYGVLPEQLIVGRGSDELIDCLIRGLCQPGHNEAIAQLSPTYGVYSHYAILNGTSTIDIERDNDFDLDVCVVDKTFQANPSIKILFVCSPNNPTGNFLAESQFKDLLRICEENSAVLVIDEAYIEYASRSSFSSFLKNSDHLAVLRTLSKAWGLAGLRIGTLLAHPELVVFLKKIIAPYPIAEPCVEGARLISRFDVNAVVEQAQRQRKWLMAEMKELSFIEQVYPSEGNFFLVRTAKAQRVYDFLAEKGILVRGWKSHIRLQDCLRISVGRPLENQKFIEALKDFDRLAKGKL